MPLLLLSRAVGLATLSVAVVATASAQSAVHDSVRFSTSRPSAAVPVIRRMDRAPSWSRVTLAGEWAHLGAGPVVRPDEPRTAVRSLVGGASVDVGPLANPTLRFELGWLRAVRSANTSQGVTAGASLPIRLGRGERLHVYPGLAVAAGWAETQGGTWLYDWRTLPGTTRVGQTGSVDAPAIERSRMTGFGAQVGAAYTLDGLFGRTGRALAVTGSLRQWAFQGAAAAPNRHVTLGGVGLAVRPWAIRGTTTQQESRR